MALGDWIKTEKTFEDDGKWIHVVKICNPTADDKKVVIIDNPYDKDHHKIITKDPNKDNIPQQTRTIKAGKCEWFVFELPTKPTGKYTDVYDAARYKDSSHSDGFIDGSLGELSMRVLKDTGQGDGEYVVLAPMPYPRRLSHLDEPLSFYVSSITGVPEGWSATLLRPESGSLFQLASRDREHLAALLIKVPIPVPEGTTAVLEIEHRVAGMSDDIRYVMRQSIPIGFDHTAPSIAPRYTLEGGTAIAVEAEVADSVSGLDRIRVHFSTDGGRTFAEKQLRAPLKSYESDADPTLFRATVGPFCAQQLVLLKVSAEDNGGNRAVSEPHTILISPEPPPPLRGSPRARKS